ncbi:MAG: TIGR04282 family arsenosugar biosynthesis glycosyltransferase [Bacteroidia bacterium]|nr:TIGR04282 family arsenosugar biosynthesis glycosyltransferase [Bacteroidia bacterium]
MNTSPRRLLLIFVKHPEKGKSKTRLAAGIGHDLALEVYRKLLAHTRDISLNLQADKVVFFGNQMPETDLWSEADYSRHQQVGVDLGERMSHAFSWGFDQGYEQICIIGSDCATLSTEILENAYKVLNEKDFVIGPAKDGGYYLIGMSDFYPKVFEDKVWSTADVRKEAIAELEAGNKSFDLLTELSDVDVVDDLRGTFLESYIP